MLDARQRRELLEELDGLRRFCLSLAGSPADADDLLQATVERLLERGMPGDAHVAKWSYRVCRNLWIDEIRSREVRQRYPRVAEAGAGGLEETAPSAEAQAAVERDLAATREALARLPAEQRMALVLVVVEGKSYAEAADILEVPIGTIMSRIARARKAMLDMREGRV